MITILLITHSISEAIFLSDKLIIFSNKPTIIKKEIKINIKKNDEINYRYQNNFKKIEKWVIKNLLK
jgi:NitT/TauT family transport system ATP-binding protein